jgi:hypothetical protein
LVLALVLDVAVSASANFCFCAAGLEILAGGDAQRAEPSNGQEEGTLSQGAVAPYAAK